MNHCRKSTHSIVASKSSISHRWIFKNRMAHLWTALNVSNMSRHNKLKTMGCYSSISTDSNSWDAKSSRKFMIGWRRRTPDCRKYWRRAALETGSHISLRLLLSIIWPSDERSFTSPTVRFSTSTFKEPVGTFCLRYGDIVCSA